MEPTDSGPTDSGPTEPPSPGLPSNVRLLDYPPTDVKEALEAALHHADEIAGVMVICLRKDGSQGLISSSMNQMEKCFLLTFAQAWVGSWFQREED